MFFLKRKLSISAGSLEFIYCILDILEEANNLRAEERLLFDLVFGSKLEGFSFSPSKSDSSSSLSAASF
jgi:hypothetical protein